MAFGSCSSCGRTSDIANIAKPNTTDGEVGEQHLAACGGAQVHQRLRGAQLPPAPQQQHDAAGGEQADREARWSSPSRRPWRSPAAGRPARPTARPRPTRSNRPPVRTADSGTSVSTSTAASGAEARRAPRTARASRRARRGARRRAARARRRRPATRSSARSPSRAARRGSSSRMMLMPSGIDTDRQALQGPSDDHRGQRVAERRTTTEPTTSSARLTSSIRRLPYMSPSRPTTGVATAPASSVAVIAQVASDAEACSSVGQFGDQRDHQGLHQRRRRCRRRPAPPRRHSVARGAAARYRSGPDRDRGMAKLHTGGASGRW